MSTSSSRARAGAFTRGAAVTKRAALVGLAATLAACSPTSGPWAPGARDLKLSGATQTGPAESETIGTGAVKIALIVPLTGPSGPSSVGASLLNVRLPAHADLHRQLTAARAEREARQQGKLDKFRAQLQRDETAARAQLDKALKTGDPAKVRRVAAANTRIAEMNSSRLHATLLDGDRKSVWQRFGDWLRRVLRRLFK